MGAVVVQVVVELVGDGGELLEEVVGVLFAARLRGWAKRSWILLLRASRSLMKTRMRFAGEVGGFAELLDLPSDIAFIVALSVKGQSESEENESEREPTEH